jgi:hypothetical protein
MVQRHFAAGSERPRSRLHEVWRGHRGDVADTAFELREHLRRRQRCRRRRRATACLSRGASAMLSLVVGFILAFLLARAAGAGRALAIIKGRAGPLNGAA